MAFDAFAIVLEESRTSERAFETLVGSSHAVGNDFQIQRFKASTPLDIAADMKRLQLNWNYPLNHEPPTMAQGLSKNPYQSRNPMAVIACALSHYRLWLRCAKSNRPLLVLEHDAMFLRKTPVHRLLAKCSYDIVGLNDPRGATRRASHFHRAVRRSHGSFLETPWVDEPSIPQGLAGNSSYLLRVSGAKKLISLVALHGLWPNDAIMNKQLLPRKIGVTRKYYTTVQKNLQSTTREMAD